MSTPKPKSSSKEKKASTGSVVKDDRFNFAESDLDSETEQPIASTSSAKPYTHKKQAVTQDSPDDKSFHAQSRPTSLPAHLLPASASSNKPQPGLIYLSRIPPGMGPSKVKHLLSAYGEVGRIYLARSDPDPPQSLNAKKRQKEKHKEHKFSEGWVEFLDKRVARSVADMLNANPIGGKKGSRWRDDVWTMKYLPRFRWDQLSEQVALERATQTSLLRFHLQHSKAEQENYLSAVEKARVGRKIQEKSETKKRGRELAGVEEAGDAGNKADHDGNKEKKVRLYKQREVVKPGAGSEIEGRSGGTKKQLDDVLGRLF